MIFRKTLFSSLFIFYSILLFAQPKLVRCTGVGWDSTLQGSTYGFETLFQYDGEGNQIFEEYRTKGINNDEWQTSYNWNKYNYINGENTIEILVRNVFVQGTLSSTRNIERHLNPEGQTILFKSRKWDVVSGWIWLGYSETTYNDEGCATELRDYEVVDDNPILKNRIRYLSSNDCNSFERERVEETYIDGEYIVNFKYIKDYIVDYTEFYTLRAYWDETLGELGTYDTTTYQKLNEQGQQIHFETSTFKIIQEFNQEGLRIFHKEDIKSLNGIDWIPSYEKEINFDEELFKGDETKSNWREDISDWGLVTTNIYEHEDELAVKHSYTETSNHPDIIPNNNYERHFEYEKCHDLIKKGITTRVEDGEIVNEIRFEYVYLEEEECEEIDLEGSIDFYPNPTNGIITLSSELLKSKDVKSIQVFDNLGRLIKIQSNFYREKIEIDLSNFPAGFYFISFEIGGELKTGKIIKY